MGYLARREHSRAELARKLAGHADPDELATLLDDLESLQLLSDRRFAASLRQSRSARHGSLRLRQDLQVKGVAADIVEDEMVLARASDEAVARTVWMKKFGQPPADAKERGRQYRFLISRGFPPDVVRRVVAGSEEGESS